MAEKEEAKTPEVKEPEASKPETKEPEVKPEAEKPQVSKEEYEQLQADFRKAQSQWETAQGIINKQNEKIESLESNQELWKVLIGMNAERKGISEEESEVDLQKSKPNLLQQFNMAEQKIEVNRLKKKIESYQPVVEQELGLKPGDDDYETIHAFVIAGKFDRADKKIAAIKAKKTEQPESKEAKVEEKKTEEKSVDEIVEAKLKEKMIEKGLLTPEGVEPSATATGSLAKIAQEYAENPTPANYKRYKEAREQS
jgi:hypothetical protein